MKLWFLLLCLWISILSPHPATPADDSISLQADRQLYTSAKQYFYDGDFEHAITAFLDYLDKYPKSPLLPEGNFLLGQAYIQAKKYREAVDPLKNVVEEYPTAPFAGQARQQLARVYLRLGMPEEAIPILEREAALNRNDRERQDLDAQIADLYLSNHEGLKAIEALLRQRELIKEREERLSLEEKIRQVVEQHLEDQQLQNLFEKYPQSFPGDEALLRLSESAYGRGDLFSAERYLSRYSSYFPKQASNPRARELISAVENRIKAYRFRIGVLLPLTGPQAPYADSVLKGIQLAMDNVQGLFNDSFVGLVIRDFEGQPAKLKTSLEELIQEYQSAVIVGPLLSKDVETVAPLVDKYKIPLMTPTATANRISPANAYTFRNTVTPEFLGKTLTEYAMLKAGLRRFVIFYPQESYGLEMMKILSEEVKRLGGEIIAAEAYPPDANDFGEEIKHVIQLDLAREGALIPPGSPGPGQKPEYVPGFDAVFLPGDALKTGLLAGQLAFYDIKDRVLLVTQAANSSEFLSAGNRFVEGAILVDGFFEGSSDPIVRNFVNRYQAKYQESPDLFAAQAYDCVQMILLALRSGATHRDQIRDFLAGVREFHGASGITTFHLAGLAEKRLFVIQVKNGKFVQVN